MRNIETGDISLPAMSVGFRSDSDAQQSMLFKLQVALRESNLLNELSGFRYLNDIVANDQFSREAINRNVNAGSMLRVKNASEHFVRLVSPFTENERRTLLDLRLTDLVTKRGWLYLLLVNHQSSYGRGILDASYDKLVFINGCKLTEDASESVKDSVLGVAVNSRSKKRQSALAAYLCGMLTLVVFVIILATFGPDRLQALHIWSMSSGVSFPSTTALLVLLLAVLYFFFITTIISHDRASDSVETKNNKAKTTKAALGFRLSPRRVIAGCTGPLLLGLGAGISATAGFGAFGVTVLLDGVHNTFATPFWVSQLIFAFSCYIFAWSWARIPLGLGTLSSLFLIGPAISFGAMLGQQELTLAGNFIAFIVGTLVFSFGVAMAASAALGPDGKTALSLAAEKKNRWPIPLSAFFFNLTFIAIGVTLGGNFGVATIANLVVVPILLHAFIPPMRRFLATQASL